MNSFSRPSFFRLFDQLMSATNSRLDHARWTIDGVEVERERHSFAGPNHGLTIEAITLTRAGRRGWSLLVVKEYWWAGAQSKPLKSFRWARPVSGARSDLVAWLRTQERALTRSSPSAHEPIASEGLDLVGKSEELRKPSVTALTSAD